MRRSPVGATALTIVLVLGGCATADVASDDTTMSDTEPTFEPLAPDADLDELLIEIEALMFGLDERIIANDHDDVVMARIDELWATAEARIRAADPDDVFNFEQAVQLARTGVERRRPADASKGYKILVDVSGAYLDR